MFGEYTSGNRSGTEDSYSDKYEDTISPFDNLDTTGIPESEQSAVQRNNQTGQGLKILTPNKMLSRLLIFFSTITGRK